MALSLKPQHLKRYKDLALLIAKYGRTDLIQSSGLDKAFTNGEALPLADTRETKEKAQQLAQDLEAMGPIYVKLGQVFSSRGDLLPAPYVEALVRLQDKLEPFSFAEVEKIVEDELGVRLSKAFSFFEATPLASASLGQVHRAMLRNGRPVAVKIQRPNIKEQVADDLQVLSDIATFLDEHTDAGKQYRFGEMLAEFGRNLSRELDYRQEARNLHQIAENLKEYQSIIIPLPVDDYTTERVLTMDYVQGRKVTDITLLARMEMNGSELAEQLFHAYLKQILLDGFFHADPHPGNVFVTDQKQLALIDLGMIGRISESMRERILRLLIAISDGQTEEASDVAIKIGEMTDNFNEQNFRQHVAAIVLETQDTTMRDLQVGRVMLEFSNVAGASGLRLPSELTMLGKTLLSLDEIGRILDPDFDPNAAIRRHAADITRRRMLHSAKPGNLLSAAIEAKEFAQEFPGRVNKILDLVSRNQLKVKIDAIDEVTLITGFQKVANRITTGLIVAALIVGASMLMRIETSFKILGYPALAILLFTFAAGVGLWMTFDILIKDRKDEEKAKKAG